MIAVIGDPSAEHPGRFRSAKAWCITDCPGGDQSAAEAAGIPSTHDYQAASGQAALSRDRNEAPGATTARRRAAAASW